MSERPLSPESRAAIERAVRSNPHISPSIRVMLAEIIALEGRHLAAMQRAEAAEQREAGWKERSFAAETLCVQLGEMLGAYLDRWAWRCSIESWVEGPAQTWCNECGHQRGQPHTDACLTGKALKLAAEYRQRADAGGCILGGGGG